MDIYVAHGQSIQNLIDEYGEGELASASTFTVECSCGEAHSLEPDGDCECECGKRVESPLLSAGLI